MRYSCCVKCTFPIATDSQNGAVDKNIFYRFSTEILVCEATKIHTGNK